MASSGTYTNNFKTGYSLQLRWNTVSQDITNNTSSVKVETWLVNTYSTSSSATKNGSITINGSTGTYTFTVGSGVINKKLFERTVAVGHNADGTMTVALSTYADINLTLSGSYVGRVSVSGSPTLDTIPRKSTFSAIPTSVVAGTAFSYDVARASSSFTHTVGFVFGTTDQWIDIGSATSGTFTPPLAWLVGIPNSTSGSMTAYVNTYSGGVFIGETSKTITLSAPASVVPTITSVTAARVDGTVPAGWGVYVQNKSSTNITINGAAGAYGSTITKYETTMSTTTKTGQTTNFTLPTSGTVTFTGKVTDSRGRTATSTVNISVEPYTPPSIATATLNRSTSAGVDDTNGTYGEVLADYTYSLVNGSGTAKNSVTTLVEYKILGGSTWTNAGTFSDNVSKVFGGGGLSTDNQYEVRLSVTDAFSTTTWSAILNTAFVTMDFLAGGRGIAFGKVASLTDTVESDFDFQLNGDLTVGGLLTPQAGIAAKQMPSNADFNNYKTPGMYFNAVSAEVATMTNKPPNSQAGGLEVVQASGVIQYWHEYNAGSTDGNVWRRRWYEATNHWSGWVLYQGPAMFDSGSNSNGNWIRFPTSGFQVCWIATSTTSIAINNAYGNLYLSMPLTWTYPRSFTSLPAASCTQFQWGTGASWGSVISNYGDYATYRGFDAISRETGTSVQISLVATGFATS